MAIAFDSSAVNLVDTPASATHSFSFNNVAGDFMVCAPMQRGGALTIPTMTYNGVNLTEKIAPVNQDALHAALFFLASPATGSNTLLVTWSGTPATNMGLIVATYSGISGDDASNSASVSSATSVSTTVTTVVDNSWVVAACIHRNDSSFVGSETEREEGLSESTTLYGIMDTNTEVGIGGKAMSYSWATSHQGIILAMNIAPTVAGLTPPVGSALFTGQSSRMDLGIRIPTEI